MLSIKIQCHLGGGSIFFINEELISAVYASINFPERKHLWRDMKDVSFQNPGLLFIKDFNSVLGSHEIFSTRHSIGKACSDFANAIDDANLVEIPQVGALFTWCNNRLGN